MKGLLELIKLIFGPKALSKTIGTRTNVIQLPNNKTKRYIKEDLNIEAASDAAAMNAKKEMEELVAEIPKMNDAERLVFEGNLRRLKNRLGIRSETDPTAEVFEFGTKEKATPKGIETLTEQAGQKSPPGTVMGNLESRLNKLRASGKELGDIAKEEGGVKFSIPEKGIFNQELSADNLFDTIIKQQERFKKIQDSGLVTSTAREILQRDIKAGKLKLPKEIEDRIMLVDGNPGTVNPVEIFRTNYGEDALEQVDSLIPELAKAQSYSDLVKIVEKKYPMKPLAKPRKETMTLDEATKAEQENILTPKKPEEPEEFAIGGRVGYKAGGVSKGLDYLTGIKRRGYVDGGNVYYPNNPFYPSSFGSDTYQTYLSYLNQPQSTDPLSSDILYSEPNTYPSSGGDGGNDEDSQTNTPSGSGMSIGTAVSNAIGSLGSVSPGKAIGTAIGYGLGLGPIGGMIGGMIGSSIGGGGDSGTTGTSTPGPGDTGGAGGDPSDPGSEAGGTGTDAAGNDTSPGATGGEGGESGDGSSGGGGGGGGGAASSPGDTGGAGGADGAGGSDAGSGADSAGDGGDGYATGGRVGFNQGTLDPAKEKQVKQMIKMGADVDTISAITGATLEQIQQLQQTSRTKNSQGGLNYLMGY